MAAAAEDNLGGVGARQVEGDPHTTAEKSKDEALKEVVRLGAASDALYDAGRQAGCAALRWCADEACGFCLKPKNVAVGVVCIVILTIHSA
jgi:hypothetical protein